MHAYHRTTRDACRTSIVRRREQNAKQGCIYIIGGNHGVDRWRKGYDVVITILLLPNQNKINKKVIKCLLSRWLSTARWRTRVPDADSLVYYSTMARSQGRARHFRPAGEKLVQRIARPRVHLYLYVPGFCDTAN
jgi:hypothetical protein